MTHNIVVSLYVISLLFQIIAVYFSFQLFRKATIYRIPCLFLMLGFLMMALTRIHPLVSPLEGKIFNEIDAIKAVVISGLIMIGMYYMIRIYTSLEDQGHIFELDAKTDAMTGALRRQETFHRLEQEISRSFRNHQPLALVMMDIDHFKFVNDRYGHLVGDVVLKNLVAFYQEGLRDIDILGRVGGEEFLVILPATNEADALEIAERLRKALQDHVIARVNHEPIKITISSGISIFDPEQELDLIHKDLANKYFQQADLAMYRAKQRGRNQSVVWSDSESA
ncbi:GGDEF domain-containing protein [Polynucleobacter sp. HIN7]|uniref:GGDEF domain-containing protein n=1 Tax=Polynucleobacter sp. HIN7 TaxID=3047866 RepID=UPI0025744A5A|nr:GGDEF domain-containing protein [Polynucleobacter sp. HIN7]